MKKIFLFLFLFSCFNVFSQEIEDVLSSQLEQETDLEFRKKTQEMLKNYKLKNKNYTTGSDVLDGIIFNRAIDMFRELGKDKNITDYTVYGQAFERLASKYDPMLMMTALSFDNIKRLEAMNIVSSSLKYDIYINNILAKLKKLNKKSFTKDWVAIEKDFNLLRDLFFVSSFKMDASSEELNRLWTNIKKTESVTFVQPKNPKQQGVNVTTNDVFVDEKDSYTALLNNLKDKINKDKEMAIARLFYEK